MCHNVAVLFGKTPHLDEDLVSQSCQKQECPGRDTRTASKSCSPCVQLPQMYLQKHVIFYFLNQYTNLIFKIKDAVLQKLRAKGCAFRRIGSSSVESARFDMTETLIKKC